MNLDNLTPLDSLKLLSDIKHKLKRRSQNGDVAGYVFDDNGDIRLVITSDDNAGRHVLINKGYDFNSTEFAPEDWEEILYWDYVNAKNSGVWSIMPDGKSFLAL